MTQWAFKYDVLQRECKYEHQVRSKSLNTHPRIISQFQELFRSKNSKRIYFIPPGPFIASSSKSEIFEILPVLSGLLRSCWLHVTRHPSAAELVSIGKELIDQEDRSLTVNSNLTEELRTNKSEAVMSELKEVCKKAISNIDKKNVTWCGELSSMECKVWLVSSYSLNNLVFDEGCITAEFNECIFQRNMNMISRPLFNTKAAFLPFYWKVTGMAIMTASYDIFCIFLVVRTILSFRDRVMFYYTDD